MNDKDRIKSLEDALDHIMRTANVSRTQTRRLRWISARALSAIRNDSNWREIDLPKKKEMSLRESKMQTFIDKAIKDGNLK